MRSTWKLAFAGAMALAVACPHTMAADSKAPTDQKGKVSYGIGMNIGMNLKRSGFDVDVNMIAEGIKDSLAGGEMKMTEEEARTAVMGYQQELRTKKEEERKQSGEKNRAAGTEWLAQNKKKEGVKAHTVTLPDGSTAELQYKVITDGSGATPGSNDTVKVNYRGTLIDGREFDSSIKRGQPAEFNVNGVIKGWTEALKMMKIGSKWELYLPSTLAYQDNGSGPMIEPGATLIFEVELLDSKSPTPPPPPQPLTSDIIRVPSAEEIKKGAKVEVLKAEDVEKMLKAATNNPATNAPLAK